MKLEDIRLVTQHVIAAVHKTKGFDQRVVIKRRQTVQLLRLRLNTPCSKCIVRTCTWEAKMRKLYRHFVGLFVIEIAGRKTKPLA